jgi:hypothetical protein
MQDTKTTPTIDGVKAIPNIKTLFSGLFIPSPVMRISEYKHPDIT